MREIKFKAYSKTLKTMFGHSSVDFWGNLKGRVGAKPSYPEYDIEPILLQFTGFKDRFGEDIYEGDIISDYVTTDKGIMKAHKQVFFDNKTGKWVVDDSFAQDKSTSSPLWWELETFEYERSGDVYLNPKLLKINP